MWIETKSKKLYRKNYSQEGAQKIDWGLKLTGIPDIWRETKGKGIKVAVLDTGIDYHIDLVQNLKGGYNFISESYNNYRDMQGHGTHCAGIIAASDNSFGVVGVAPEASLYACKVLNDKGCGTNRAIANAIHWCIKNKIDIVSMSLGCKEDDPFLRTAIKEAYQAGIILVAAAGNDGDEYLDDDIDYPGKYEEVICVGSVNKYLDRSWFSSDGEELDITAPGENILSTYLNNSYATLSGTSMATPFIAGLAALILAKHRTNKNETPILNNRQMMEHILRFTNDKGEIGKDRWYGYGVVSYKIPPPENIFVPSARYGKTRYQAKLIGEKEVKIGEE